MVPNDLYQKSPELVLGQLKICEFSFDVLVFRYFSGEILWFPLVCVKNAPNLC